MDDFGTLLVELVEANAVDGDGGGLGVEADVFSCLDAFGQRVGQAPGRIRLAVVSDGEVPVLAVALVGALRHGVAQFEQVEADVGPWQ